MGLIVGIAFRYPFPERRTVIQLDRMRQFVDQNIIDYFKREFHKGDVQADDPFAIAAAPAAAGM